jgi:hypothetical protein
MGISRIIKTAKCSALQLVVMPEIPVSSKREMPAARNLSEALTVAHPIGSAP